MKRQWQIRRQFQTTADAARRWDQAYQLLLQWSQATEPTAAPAPLNFSQSTTGGDA